MTTIFIVEDEPKLALVLEKYVQAAGYDALVFDRGDVIVEAAREHSPDLILLDIMLPKKDGIEVCKELRAFSDVPIVMVTAKVEEIDRLIGLELGADDYICKPFSPREVIARVKAILKRTARSEPNGLSTSSTSGLMLDKATFQASLNGTMLDLTPIEFKILAALFGPPSAVLNRDALMEHMYSDHRAVSDRTVDSHVANLRKKLKLANPDAEYIQPIYGVGYRFSEPS